MGEHGVRKDTLSDEERERIRARYDELAAYAEHTPSGGEEYPYSSSHIERMKEFFRIFDRDNLGAITARELGTVMRALLLTPTDAEIEERIRAADNNSDGRIDFTEFVTMVNKHGLAFGLAPLVAYVQSAELLTDTGKVRNSGLPHAQCVAVPVS